MERAMSVDATKAVWEVEGVPPAHRVVLLYLAYCMNHERNDGRVWPYLKTIAQHTSLSYTRTREIMYDFRRAGVVEVVEPARGHRAPRYVLHLHRLGLLTEHLEAARVSPHRHPGCRPTDPLECRPSDPLPKEKKKGKKKESSPHGPLPEAVAITREPVPRSDVDPGSDRENPHSLEGRKTKTNGSKPVGLEFVLVEVLWWREKIRANGNGAQALTAKELEAVTAIAERYPEVSEAERLSWVRIVGAEAVLAAPRVPSWAAFQIMVSQMVREKTRVLA
ncbi:unnamed protein product [marine sediment metagenome]|uniref:Helix-turn-helix domain-containing protein n=1 Tax=marine sediment metagenome TaxID=412755 RepID=X0SU31_9ZZZZ